MNNKDYMNVCELYFDKNIRSAELAAKYGVTQVHIHRIIRKNKELYFMKKKIKENNKENEVDII